MAPLLFSDFPQHAFSVWQVRADLTFPRQSLCADDTKSGKDSLPISTIAIQAGAVAALNGGFHFAFRSAG
jgi:hypothetical protein